MKQNKIGKCFAAILIVLVALQANTILAACGGSTGIYCNPTSNDDLRDGIIAIIKYLFSIIGIFSLIFMVIGGIKYMTSGGSEKNITSAKESFSSAVYGLVVALLAYGILDIIQRILN